VEAEGARMTAELQREQEQGGKEKDKRLGLKGSPGGCGLAHQLQTKSQEEKSRAQ